MNKFSYVSKSSFFFLNFINCFEEGENGNLIVDLVTYESPQILENMYLDKLRQGKFENDDKSTIHRYILPLNITDKVEGKVDITKPYVIVCTKYLRTTDCRKASGMEISTFCNYFNQSQHSTPVEITELFLIG